MPLLYVADRWRTRTSSGYNCEIAHPACRKRRLLGTHHWQLAFLIVGLPVLNDWFEMGCNLSPSLIQLGCRHEPELPFVPYLHRKERKG